MKREKVILRKWSSRIRTAGRQTYVRHVLDTGIRDYAKTPGNLGYQVLTRDLGEGATEITMLSWWKSMDAIQAFAGPNVEEARHYPEDECACSREWKFDHAR